MILFHLCRRWCGNMWYVLVIWCGYLAESSCNILEWELDDVCTCCTGCILNDLKCIQMQHTTVPYWSRHFGLRQWKPWAEILAEMSCSKPLRWHVRLWWTGAPWLSLSMLRMLCPRCPCSTHACSCRRDRRILNMNFNTVWACLSCLCFNDFQ